MKSRDYRNQTNYNAYFGEVKHETIWASELLMSNL